MNDKEHSDVPFCCFTQFTSTPIVILADSVIPMLLQGIVGIYKLEIVVRLNHKIGRKEAHKSMRMVGLDYDLHRHIRKYCLDMRLSLRLAQSIIEKLKILIFDEPFKVSTNKV